MLNQTVKGLEIEWDLEGQVAILTQVTHLLAAGDAQLIGFAHAVNTEGATLVLQLQLPYPGAPRRNDTPN